MTYESRRTTVGLASSTKPYQPNYHDYPTDSRFTSPAPSNASVASYDQDDVPMDARMTMPSVFASAPSIHRAQSDYQQPLQRANAAPPARPYSDYRADTASVYSVSSTHSVPARHNRPLSGASQTSSLHGNRVLPLPSPTPSSTTPILEHRRPPSFLDNLPANSQRFSTLSDPDFFRLRISDSPRSSMHEEPPIHLPPIRSPAAPPATLSRKRSSSSITSAFSQYPESSKARSMRSFQSHDRDDRSSFADRSSIASSFNPSESDSLELSLPQGWSGPPPSSEPRKVGRSSAAAARIMQRRMKKNQMDSSAMGIEAELTKIDIEEDSLRYTFIVVQQPVRARACGFGDKDRRPLSPTPIIKCIVHDRQGNVVDPMSVQIHQLIMSIDLWDETGRQERNLIVHPAAGSTSTNVSPPQTASTEDLTMAVDEEPVARGMSRTPRPDADLSITGWSPATTAQKLPAETRKSALPDIQIRQNSQGSAMSTVDSTPLSFRPLKDDDWDRRRSSTSTFVSTAPSYSTRNSVDSSLHDVPHNYSRPSEMYRPSGLPEAIPERSPASSIDSRHRRADSIQVPTDAMSAFSLGPPSSSSRSGSTASFPLISPFDRTTFSPSSSTMSLPPLAPPPVAGNYSRTLFGGLVTTAHRLTDLDGEMGIFFFGHEVSVRSEGRFRLRFCLMKVGDVRIGAPSPLLAEVLSDPFTVMSAKRFVGVLDTTDLTRHFLKQGVKLPIRRKKAVDAAGSDEDD